MNGGLLAEALGSQLSSGVVCEVKEQSEVHILVAAMIRYNNVETKDLERAF